MRYKQLIGKSILQLSKSRKPYFAFIEGGQAGNRISIHPCLCCYDSPVEVPSNYELIFSNSEWARFVSALVVIELLINKTKKSWSWQLYIWMVNLFPSLFSLSFNLKTKAYESSFIWTLIFFLFTFFLNSFLYLFPFISLNETKLWPIQIYNIFFILV